MKRYLTFWLSMTGLLLLATAAFNIVIDPYGLFRFVDQPGLNKTKPAAGAHGPMVKAYQVLRVQPYGLIFGNSRAEVGFDPEHPAWPKNGRPVFNLALPGTGTTTTLQYLEHTLANPGAPKPRVVLWGIDFMDFLVDPTLAPRAALIKRNDYLLQRNIDGSDTSKRWFVLARDHAKSAITLNALLDSVHTVASQRSAYAADLTPLGFNPMRDYLKITADEGYWNVFRQKDQSNINAYLRRPKSIFDADGRSSPNLNDFREVLDLCRQHDIALHLVIYPYHAHLLEIIRITGHWPAFEAWKRELAQIVAKEAINAGKTPFPIWDFGEFNSLTMEAIPEKGDRKSTMLWYWEAGHFKYELGNLVQDRVFGNTEKENPFGMLLNLSNVDERNASVRSQEVDYRRTHPRDVEHLERMAADASLRLKIRSKRE
jgi:hypothetical protein